MACTHPVILDGKCIACGALLNGEKQPDNAAPHQDGQTPTETAKQPETGEKPTKTGTRKRKTT